MLVDRSIALILVTLTLPLANVASAGPCEPNLTAGRVAYASAGRVQRGPSCSVYGAAPLLETIFHRPISSGYWGLAYAWDEIVEGRGRGGLDVAEVLGNYGVLTADQVTLSPEFTALFAPTPGASHEVTLDAAAEILVGFSEAGDLRAVRRTPLFRVIEREIEALRHLATENQLKSRRVIPYLHVLFSLEYFRAHAPLLITWPAFVPGVTTAYNRANALAGSRAEMISNARILERVRASIRAGYAATFGVNWSLLPREAITRVGEGQVGPGSSGKHTLAVVGFEMRDGQYHYRVQDTQRAHLWNAREFDEQTLRLILMSAEVYEP